jgi:hypothetical protein
MASKRQRTSFAKLQRERARMEKAAEKRARRQARKDESDDAADPVDGANPSSHPSPDPDGPRAGAANSAPTDQVDVPAYEQRK